MGMKTKAATKDLAKFFFIGKVWLLSDPLITRSPGCSDSFLPSGVTNLVTVHCRILGTASQTGDKPDCHRRVEKHRRPQRNSVQPQGDTGESEDRGGDKVIHQHRNDQSSRSAALRVTARQPAGDTEREQRGSRDATEGYARAGNFGTEQQPNDNSGHGD